MPEKITASYKIVTPMFIGDAEQNASGISPASVKGALRFWWRALNWGRVLKEAKDEAAALALLHKQETALFGGLPETVKDEQAGKDCQKGGQGAFLLRVTTNNIKIFNTNELDNNYDLKESWQSYLLGLGLIKYDKDKKQNFYQRSAIVSGTFTVKLYCKNSNHLQELESLLTLWGLLGGLGSRQRKGLGSIAITELVVAGELRGLPESRKQVIDILKQIIDSSATDYPPFTAFGQKAKILCSPENKQTPWQRLGATGKDMQLFRGWGFSANGGEHKINKIPVNHQAYSCKEIDHETIYKFLDQKKPPKHLPKNYVFGLPRSYNLSTKPNKSELKLEVFARDKNDKADDKNKRSRRASPVFVHVHQFTNEETMVIQSFLPAVFLPSHDLIQIKHKIGSSWPIVEEVAVDPVTDWRVVDEYFKSINTNWLAV